MSDKDMNEFDDFKQMDRNGRGQRSRSRSPMRSRSRSPHYKRTDRSRDRGDRRMGGGGGATTKVRLYVCNMPYDVSWQDLKDLFKKEIGASVTYVELYDNPDGKPSGSGAVEIRGRENADKAIEKMDRFEMNGRKIIVREERDKDRLRHQKGGGGRDGPGSVGGGGGMGGGNMPMPMDMPPMGGGLGGGMGMGMPPMAAPSPAVNSLAGVNPQVLQQLGVDPSNVTNQIFVSNLDYKVNERKLREIFKMSGTVIDTELKVDSEGKSRGMATVRFEHPIEAVQAISMFNGQVLYDRTVRLKMDTQIDASFSPQQIPNKLPSGLKSIGMGLGAGGAPVNIQQLHGNPAMGQGAMGGMGNMGGMGMAANPQMGMGMGGMGGNMSSGMGMAQGMNTGMGMASTAGMGMGGMAGMGDSMGMGNASMGMMGMTDLGMSSGNGGMGMGLGQNLGSSMGGGMGGGSMGGGMGIGMGGGGMGGGGMRGGDMRGGDMSMQSGGRRGGGMGGGMDSADVFVRNLPFNFTWQDLKAKFSKCGDVKFAEIKMENGKSKGYGTVRFNSLDDARRAINIMNGARIDGRQIEVRLNR